MTNMANLSQLPVNVSDDVRVFMKVTYSITIPIILSLCLLAIIANAVVLLSIRWIRAINLTPTLKLTFSLAASDIWTSVVIAISLFHNSYKPIVLGNESKSACFPLALEAFRTAGLLTGVFHLLALSVNHYISIARPFDYQRILTPLTTILIILAMWVLPLAALLILFSSLPEAGFNSPDGKCMNVEFYYTLSFRLIIALLIISLMTIMCTLYARIMVILNQMRAKLDSSKRSQVQLSRQRKRIMTTWLIFGTFLVGWLPISVQFVLTAQGMPLRLSIDATLAQRVPMTIFAMISLTLIMIKSLTNPVIYATRIPEIGDFITRVQSALFPCFSSHGDSGCHILTEETAGRITKNNGSYRSVPCGTDV